MTTRSLPVLLALTAILSLLGFEFHSGHVCCSSVESVLDSGVAVDGTATMDGTWRVVASNPRIEAAPSRWEVLPFGTELVVADGAVRTIGGATNALSLLGAEARLDAGEREFEVNATDDGLVRFAVGAVDGASRAQFGVVAGAFGESMANAVVVAKFETTVGAAEGSWDVTLERVLR